MKKPLVTDRELPSGSRLIRFNDLNDIFYYDDKENNPRGLGMYKYYSEMPYLKERLLLTKKKLEFIQAAEKSLSVDPEFLQLIHKAKSDKRKTSLNKFVGNFSPVQYARNEDKMFSKGVPLAKKSTIDMAFQVGTFIGGDYTQSFINILKVILMARAMNINMNIDVFDSDTAAIKDCSGSYVICNVAKSYEKLNFKNLLVFSHTEFFDFTLFNGYSASNNTGRIHTFLGEDRIRRDLSPFYDVIGGNMKKIKINEGTDEMVSKIIKIATK